MRLLSWLDSPKRKSQHGGRAASRSRRKPALFNGDFEETTILNEPGFGGWVRSPEENKIKLK